MLPERKGSAVRVCSGNDVVPSTGPGGQRQPELVEGSARNQSREAATAGVVSVDVGDRRIGEESLDQSGGLGPLSEIGFDHHVVGVETAQRERAAGKRGRNGAARGEAGAGFADEDRALLVIGRIGALMGVIQQDDVFADLGVVERDAAWRCVLVFDADASSAAERELVITHGMEMGEGRGIEAGDLECHAVNVVQIARVRWPLSDLMMI